MLVPARPLSAAAPVGVLGLVVPGGAGPGLVAAGVAGVLGSPAVVAATPLLLLREAPATGSSKIEEESSNIAILNYFSANLVLQGCPNFLARGPH